MYFKKGGVVDDGRGVVDDMEGELVDMEGEWWIWRGSGGYEGGVDDDMKGEWMMT